MAVTYQEVAAKVMRIDEMRCNLCGELIAPWEGAGDNYEYATLSAHWGYGSKHDLEHAQAEICETCFYEKLVPMMKIPPAIKESLA